MLTEKRLLIFHRLIINKIKQYHLTMKTAKKTCDVNTCYVDKLWRNECMK